MQFTNTLGSTADKRSLFGVTMYPSSVSMLCCMQVGRSLAARLQQRGIFLTRVCHSVASPSLDLVSFFYIRRPKASTELKPVQQIGQWTTTTLYDRKS